MSRRWDAWAPWLIIFGPVASGLGWIAGMLILWTTSKITLPLGVTKLPVSPLTCCRRSTS